MQEALLLIRLMTIEQRKRLYIKVWKDATDGDGYQPWGWDSITFKLVNPNHWNTLKLLSPDGKVFKPCYAAGWNDWWNQLKEQKQCRNSDDSQNASASGSQNSQSSS